MPSNVSPELLSQAIFLMQALIALGVLLPFIRIGISIWAARRQPSITEQLYKDYATKKDLEKLENHFNETMTEYFVRQHNESSAINDKFQAIMQSIGEIKGQLKSVCRKG